MSIAASAKARLFGAGNVLSGLVALTGVTIAYNKPPRDIPREVIHGGKVFGPRELSAMRGGGSNRVRREEKFAIQGHIRVYQLGQLTSEVIEARAVALFVAVEEYIAANPTLEGLTSLKLAQVSDFELDSYPEDEGIVADLTFTVALHSFLT